ncbi:MAG: hypothetical protein Q9171_004496 [Xanthocarpia ochracea]
MQLSKAVLLSAGGNDAHLAVILNYCVYQWSDKWFWTRDGELDSGKGEVNFGTYASSLEGLLQAIEVKLANAHSRIYWAGYMRFFDDTSTDCDAVTWAFSCNHGFRRFLRQARRKRSNKLTDLVNQKIQEACKTVDRCVYVDSEPTVDKLGGRMCMPGVNENYYGGIDSPVDGWNRERTVFYEWSTTKDNDGDEEKNVDQPQKGKRDDPLIPLDPRNDIPGPLNNDTFQGAIGNFILEGTSAGTMDIEAARAGEVNAEGLTTWMGRCFYLTKFGNVIIASNIITAMINEQSKMMEQPAEPIVIDFNACPLKGLDLNASIFDDPHDPSAPSASPSTFPDTLYVVEGGEGAKIGKCHLHLDEYHTCDDDERNLAAEVRIWDVGGNNIGFQPRAEAGATKPLSVKSKLEDVLIVTPQHQGDYVQFQLGKEAFDTTQQDEEEFYWCSVGGWDPKRMLCRNEEDDFERKRGIDCYFQCSYHGGTSSDA